MIINQHPHNGAWAYWQDQLFQYRSQPGKPAYLVAPPGVVPTGDFEQSGETFLKQTGPGEAESIFTSQAYGFVGDEPYEVTYDVEGLAPGLARVVWPQQGGLTQEQVAQRGLQTYDRLTFGGEKPLAEVSKVIQVRGTQVRSRPGLDGFPAPADVGPATLDEPDFAAVLGGLATEALGGLAAAVAATAPEGWQGAGILARALGGRLELTTVVTLADGQEYYWAPPPQIGQWVHRLRLATYRPETGAWFTADFRLVPGGEPTIEFDFQTAPDWALDFAAGEAALTELAILPRSAAATPPWLFQQAWQAYQDLIHHDRIRTQQAVQQGENAKPVPQPELALARLFDKVAEGEPPVAYRTRLSHTEWLAVQTYLQAAPVVLSSRGYAPDLLHPEQESLVPMAYHTDGVWVWSAALAYYLREHDVVPPLELLDHLRGQDYRPPVALPKRVLQRATSLVMDMPETHPGAKDDWERAVFSVRDFAIRFSISRRYLSFGDYADQAWCLFREADERFTVFWWWADDKRRELEARFDDVSQAATYLIGQLYLNYPNLQRADDEPLLPEESPIQAMGNDPAISRYDEIDSVIVPEGHQVERYGPPDGNTLFDAGTGFERTTLPPEFAQGPYGRFRLVGDWKIIGARTRPSETQPGGARVYLLPQPLSDYLARGLLVEIPPGEVRQ
ncbi:MULTISPECIES: TNT domain-containing protein [unclassified Crossiella]|uniref:TNT domain-containing protein n=1 Tax=unclassified Crossiella TaxID=2620835 RepID=UPI001FFF2FC9|nr:MULTISPECIES: TNT domain-containing protein [unclassified Crossiella]MCK2236840.1 TNT domain-containing protein [Crossiella sp. S99.2]MCK2250508.1 TNT domain-containing protein [Crossiella sp. S99.1]